MAIFGNLTESANIQKRRQLNCQLLSGAD